ncbi:hypothetical protein PHYBLDRAFT_62220 [Phycomyces blakesleeanus NRRL 1555(-)]|uniref:Uncharacterized protein n=1 Tax=Phycomyces blakesleeanus (strain ATCC 8743b / DSM 1359 / FGSC 10004 / NBRC 33097 / NRRL 1555) TaxID=763407 RepID=A0A163EJZ0_PHYB8|nr:hypothetical protein PHYBLDRAFT_62220 [Phycomyces blakesleeanus NRRL 1555(-)]OAD79010.1 hypothetical protein PHYBLDRAFT_62220 [Phycomyces blakesleeanus NRRL 1555(-)]|eukprot:XP_018297050.1 hypothetical protein PHYBLDRAFT_62220 [Phycomyces blakesleeanus NRRL 1555(-)]
MKAELTTSESTEQSMEQVFHNNDHTADLTLHLVAEGPQDQRRYNAPNTNEVTVLIMNNDTCTTRDIVLHIHTSNLQSINEYHRSYDALHYVLMFPYGKDGWNLGSTSLSGKPVTVMQ